MNRLRTTLLAGVLLCAELAHADQRLWAWTYGSAMLEPGEAELEHYTTLESPDWSQRETNLAAVQQFELEIGMGPRLDAAVYQVFSREPGASLDWAGYKVRLRWRLNRDPEALGHPLLYLEHKNNNTLSDAAAEAKLLLSQRVGMLDLAFNPVVELHGDDVEFESLAGVSVPLSPRLNLGCEARSSEHGHYLGPVISHGGEGLWAVLGAGWRLGSAEPSDITHELRLILGVRVKE